MNSTRRCRFLVLFSCALMLSSISFSQFVGSFEMISNGNGAIPTVAGFDVTIPSLNHGAYSADWYRDVLQSPNPSATILQLPNGMQAAGGWYFVVAGGNTVMDFQTAQNRWTRNGSRNDIIRGKFYEIRFTASGGKAIMSFTSQALVDVPFGIWYLAGTPNDPSDDVRMIPWIYDVDGDNVFNFQLDHSADGGVDDPYSDWIYFIMPVDDSPGQAGYDCFVQDAMNGTYSLDIQNEQEHLARVVLMNWNRHQNESDGGAGDGPVNAMPETGTTFRLSFHPDNIIVDIKPGTAENSVNCQNPKSVIPVAILSTPDVDVMQIDPATVVFGWGSAKEMHGAPHLEDVDSDGDLDLLFHFLYSQTGIMPNEEQATLFGRLYSGIPVRGTDSIHFVRPDPIFHGATGTHDGNDVVLYVAPNGHLAYDGMTYAQGYFPKRTTNPYVFDAGPWVGGKVDGIPIVAEVQFLSEFVPSQIGNTGEQFRLFNSSVSADRKSWPPEFSTAEGDPIIVHKAQNLVVQYNDLYGTPARDVKQPLGIEVCQRSLAYGDAFKRSAIIFLWEIKNISSKPIQDAYFGFWEDVDIGFAYDDRTSTVNDMTIFWDQDFSDSTITEKPAIVAFDFLETPGNHGVSNFTAFTNWNDGNPDPRKDGLQYSFLSGASHYETYWTGDVRALLSTGPFNLAPGENAFVAGALLFARVPVATQWLGTDPLRPWSDDIVLAQLLQLQSEVREYYELHLKGQSLAKSGAEGSATKTTISDIPREFALHQNYPNPFNPSTTIGYDIPRAAHVSLKIYNTLGQVVASLADEHKEPGYYQVQWNATVPSGIYFCQLQARDAVTASSGGFVELKKLVLLK